MAKHSHQKSEFPNDVEVDHKSDHMNFWGTALPTINPPFGTEADSPFLAKQGAGRWKNTVGQNFQIRILQSLNWILAMNAW